MVFAARLDTSLAARSTKFARRNRVSTRGLLLGLIGALFTVSVSGCKRSRRAERVDTALVSVDTKTMRVRRDVVGQDKFAHETTFVLVDAVNRHDRDLMVTLGGSLVNVSGAKLSTLRPDALRVPAGKRRTFALVAPREDANPAGPSVAELTARVDVLSAMVLEYPASFVVKEGYVHPDNDYIMASATVVNRAKRDGKVVVIGAFYDESGKLMTRPFTVMQLAAESSHAVHFRSKPGAREGYIFVGQTVF